MRELASPETRKLACPRRLVGAVSERSRRRAQWHGNAEVSQGLNCVAGAAFWQGRVQISWQAQHFHKVKFSQGLSCMAGAALSIGQVQISWQAQHFRKVKYRIRGRCSTFDWSGADFVAGAALSQGQAQNSGQVQHFRKVKCRIRGRRRTFARSTFAAGARKSQLLSTKVVREVHFRSWGSKIPTFKYESSTRSPLSQLGLENRNFEVRK